MEQLTTYIAIIAACTILSTAICIFFTWVVAAQIYQKSKKRNPKKIHLTEFDLEVLASGNVVRRGNIDFTLEKLALHEMKETIQCGFEARDE